MWRPLLLLLLAASVFAEEPFNFDTNPGRLPKTAVPKKYTIHLDFHGLAQAEFAGDETVEVQVRQPVKELIFNSLELTLSAATWSKDASQPGSPVKVTSDDKTEFATVTFETEQAPGTYFLKLHWDGKLTEHTHGIYLTRFDTPAGERKAVSTQMEAASARRMFPSWDEPAFRAVYEISATVPATYLTSSNMPALSEQPAGADFKEVKFGPTLAMASYLVAFTTGEFDVLEDDVAGIHLRMISTPGKREQTRYALEATKKILPFYNEYFGTKYPLPKLDQVSYPGFAAGGMENWGSIIYNDTAMIVDPATATQANRQRVFSVVAHEIAHQWFGDLVTMGWWDNLWLNEGFASWMAFKCTDHFNPEWRMGERAAASKETAMTRDARSSTHPIQQPVENEAQAGQAFDEITYQKGGAFLRMLEAYLGPDIFEKGISQYMAHHAMSNTTTADLWADLGDASGKPVRTFAANWTEQPGFPVIVVKNECVYGRQMVTLKQEHFTIHQNEPKPLTWEIPVVWATAAAMSQPHVKMLSAEPVTFDAGPCGTAVIINAGGYGYYRAQYDDKTFAAMIELAPSLPEADRVNLLLDSWALVQAGRLHSEHCLALINKLVATEHSPTVWPEITHTLRSMEYLSGGNARIRKWACSLVQPQAKSLGWTVSPGEDELTKAMRADLLAALGEWDDAPTLAEAQRLYAAGVAKLVPEMRPVVLRLVGQGADAKLWAQLHERAKAEPEWEVKNQYYHALCAARRSEQAQQALEISLTDELPPPQAARLVNAVADSAMLPELAWVFAKQHEKALRAKLPAMRADSFFSTIAKQFTDAEWADELQVFANQKLPDTAKKSVAQAKEDITFKASFKATFLPELQRYIAATTGS